MQSTRQNTSIIGALFASEARQRRNDSAGWRGAEMLSGMCMCKRAGRLPTQGKCFTFGSKPTCYDMLSVTEIKLAACHISWHCTSKKRRSLDTVLFHEHGLLCFKLVNTDIHNCCLHSGNK